MSTAASILMGLATLIMISGISWFIVVESKKSLNVFRSFAFILSVLTVGLVILVAAMAIG